MVRHQLSSQHRTGAAQRYPQVAYHATSTAQGDVAILNDALGHGHGLGGCAPLLLLQSLATTVLVVRKHKRWIRVHSRNRRIYLLVQRRCQSSKLPKTSKQIMPGHALQRKGEGSCPIYVRHDWALQGNVRSGKTRQQCVTDLGAWIQTA